MILKIDLKSMFGFIMMLIMFEPWYIGQFAGFHYVNILLRVLAITLFAIYAIANKEYKVPYFYWMILGIFLFYIIGSISSNSDIFSAIILVANVCLKCMFLIFIFSRNGEYFSEYIDGMSWYMVLICIINTISLIIPFVGIEDSYVKRNYFFLGSDNSSTPIYLVAILITYLRQKCCDSKKTNHFIISIFTFAFIAFYQKVATAVVSLLIIIVLGIIYKGSSERHRIKMKTLCLTCMGAWLIILSSSMHFMQGIIDGLLYGKYESISSRVELWRLFLDRIMKKPFYGYGVAENVDETQFFGVIKWVMQHNTHNTFLEIMYNGGLIAFTLFIVLIFVCAIHFDKYSQNKESAFIAIIIFGYLVRGLVECDGVAWFFLLPFSFQIEIIERRLCKNEKKYFVINNETMESRR